ncbi:MAG: YbgC/FadM family acyl-CoA thioesterase [Alphaproteobacteria bacterium]|nr:YbgC/FadM family acyl-CoA thioesterase [Alphaproteobacteria bacterium]
MNKNHSFSFRVYIEDTDLGGIVYHSNYLKFAERARTECLRSLGVSYEDLMKKGGATFIVRSCYLNCLAFSRLDDVLEVQTHFKKLGGVKLEVFQAIRRGDQLIATLDVVLACINSSGKPLRLDANLANKLRIYFGEH